MACIGIDLGTTHGCVGVYHNGKVNILANNQGVRTTPCYVSFQDGETIVGESAVQKMHSNPKNTIFHLKHAIGHKHESIIQTERAKSWQFDLVKGVSGQPCVEVENGNVTQLISPEKFCTMLIANLKQLAHDFTGETITHAVLTTPSHYTEAQRECLKRAAEEDHLNVLSILDESVAAALAYGLDVKSNSCSTTPEYVIVYDLGGATHDVSLLCVDNGLIRILSSAGGNTVGGESFTEALVEHCLKSFQKQHPSMDIRNSQRAMGRLKLACDTAKRSLSKQSRVTIEVDSIMDGIDLHVKVSQSRFEDLIFDSVRSTISDIQKVIDEGELEVESIDKVLLVGGATRTPLVKAQIEKFFGKPIECSIINDEAVATGATIQANELFSTLEYDIKLQDSFPAMPLSLGLAAGDGSMVHILNRNSLLPAEYSETFTTVEDNQSALFFEVYEGERLVADKNILLAQFTLSDLPMKPKGEVLVNAKFKISTKGTLTITACEESSGKSKTMVIESAPSRLTSDQVRNLIQEAKDAEEEDEAKLAEIEAAALADELESTLAVNNGNNAAGVVSEEDMD